MYVCMYFILAAPGLSCGMRDLVAACRIFQFQHVDFLVAACKLLVAACMRDLVFRSGIEPGPPALGAQSLTHWTTREVPACVISFVTSFLSFL